MMLLAQALFALGQYDEAAGATQAAMQMLPEDKWGVVVTNYSQLYGNVQDYTDQLKALEKARDAKPDNPALRFLLGFHFGYLNYPEARREGAGQGADDGARRTWARSSCGRSSPPSGPRPRRRRPPRSKRPQRRKPPSRPMANRPRPPRPQKTARPRDHSPR